MNFRSYNYLLEFRSRDGRHAAHSPSVREGLPGVIRGLPGGIREVCGSGHAAQPEASGGNYHMLTSRRIRGSREAFGILPG